MTRNDLLLPSGLSIQLFPQIISGLSDLDVLAVGIRVSGRDYWPLRLFKFTEHMPVSVLLL
jgi:hypothetical protein